MVDTNQKKKETIDVLLLLLLLLCTDEKKMRLKDFCCNGYMHALDGNID